MLQLRHSYSEDFPFNYYFIVGLLVTNWLHLTGDLRTPWLLPLASTFLMRNLLFKPSFPSVRYPSFLSGCFNNFFLVVFQSLPLIYLEVIWVSHFHILTRLTFLVLFGIFSQLFLYIYLFRIISFPCWDFIVYYNPTCLKSLLLFFFFQYVFLGYEN